jgi:hypothetical protein
MNNFSGWFVGTCTNTTVGASANLLLLIHAVSSATVHGELGLSGELSGGGPFHGRINGDHLVFTTCMPIVQTVIEWRAKMSEGTVSGTYSVACDNPEILTGGFGRQEGVWACSFVRGLETPDPEKRGLVWVFDAGVSDGPISREEFVKSAGSGRWPDNAIVAMADCTSWTSVGQFLDTKAAGEN